MRGHRVAEAAAVVEELAWGRAMAWGKQGGERRRRAHYGVGQRALDRYLRHRDPMYLDSAIRDLRVAVRLSAGDGSDGVGDAGLLGWALRLRIELGCDPADVDDVHLDEAVGCFRLVLRGARAPEERDAAVEQLCDLLVLRFRRGGNGADLDECLEVFWTHALNPGSSSAGPEDAPGAVAAAQAVRLKKGAGGRPVPPAVDFLLRGHRLRPLQTGPGNRMKSVFNEPYTVIAARRHAEDGQEWPGWELAVRRRERQRPDWELAAELDVVIPQLRAALAGNDDPDLLSDLADALMARWIAVPGDQSSDELVAGLRRVVAGLPASEAAQWRRALVVALADRYLRQRRPEDAEEATALLEQVAAVPGQSTDELLDVAELRGDIAAAVGDWYGAVAGYRSAIALLPRLATRHLSSADHARQMARLGGLAANAAAVAVRAEDPAQALELIEQGRGLLIGRTLDLQDEVDQLPPELARYLRLLARGLSAGVEDGSSSAGAATSVVDLRRDMAREWDQTVERIRRLPGLEGFLRPLTAARLVHAAQAGPVVVPVISTYGSHALLVTAGGVRAVALPALTWEAVVEQVGLFLRTLGVAGLSGSEEEAIEAQRPLREVLAWLWDAVAEPVLEQVGSASRIWWVPTGPLSYLPLHAAGRNGECVLDRVVSSYAPTVRSLLTSRERRSGRDDMQVVAVADAPGLPPLPGVVAEADRLVQSFPRARQLRGTAATPTVVLKALAEAGWVHFACHAVGEADPTRSALWVHGGPVSVADLLAHGSTGGELAYLSACQTAATADDRLTDEVLHLSSAFQVAGYRHVVGTLWSVSDRTAAQTAALFYGDLTAAPLADLAPVALHRAVREVRRRYPLLPTRWAPYIHLGP